MTQLPPERSELLDAIVTAITDNEQLTLDVLAMATDRLIQVLRSPQLNDPRLYLALAESIQTIVEARLIALHAEQRRDADLEEAGKPPTYGVGLAEIEERQRRMGEVRPIFPDPERRPNLGDR